MKLHEEDKPFICDVCGKRYHDQNAVKLHMVGHLEVLPFACTYCDKRFRHRGLLNVSWFDSLSWAFIIDLLSLELLINLLLVTLSN